MDAIHHSQDADYLDMLIDISNTLGEIYNVTEGCYTFGIDFYNRWNNFTDVYDFIEYMTTVGENIAIDYEVIDERSWSIYTSYADQEFTQMTFDIFRICYIIFFQNVANQDVVVDYNGIPYYLYDPNPNPHRAAMQSHHLREQFDLDQSELKYLLKQQ